MPSRGSPDATVTLPALAPNWAQQSHPQDTGRAPPSQQRSAAGGSHICTGRRADACPPGVRRATQSQPITATATWTPNTDHGTAGTRTGPDPAATKTPEAAKAPCPLCNPRHRGASRASAIAPTAIARMPPTTPPAGNASWLQAHARPARPLRVTAGGPVADTAQRAAQRRQADNLPAQTAGPRPPRAAAPWPDPPR